MVVPTITLWLSSSFILFLLGKLFKSVVLERFGLNIAISLDQLANVLLLGDCDETISSRTGRAIMSNKPKIGVIYLHKIVDFLAKTLFKDENHCINAVEDDIKLHYELWNWIKD